MPVEGRVSALNRGTTAEEVATLLRETIMDGRLKPGEQLREEGLSAQFDVSRRTIRDALGILARERIVRHYRHKGSRVVLFTEEDIRDLYRVRTTLEGSAAARAATLTDAQLRQLSEAFDRLAEATDSGQAQAIVQRDLEFHQAVVGLIGSTRVDDFFAGIAVEMRFALSILETTYQESTHRPAEALAEHRAILEAFLHRDTPEAARLVQEHADSNERLLVEVVASTDITALAR
ncbi:GntR family transcriptional regulator [Kribbella sp. NPDC058693]|nr:GntR family transcriptional regulator [Kribbella jiaozuonensis]